MLPLWTVLTWDLVLIIILFISAKKDRLIFYWLYMSLFWTQCITPVVLVILIAVNKNEDGPTLSVKVRNVLFVLKGALPQNLAKFSDLKLATKSSKI